MLNKGGNLIAGKQFTDLAKASALKDTNIIAVHDGNGLKKASMEDVTMYMSDKFSNTNLLINPDFKINQRGDTSYERQGYSVDRWKISNVTVTPNNSGGITVKNDKYSDTGTFVQILENATEGDSTLSCYVTSVSGTVTMVADDNSQVVLKQGLNVVVGLVLNFVGKSFVNPNTWSPVHLPLNTAFPIYLNL